jgi:glycerol-3-phosphate cytidylyltransferase
MDKTVECQDCPLSVCKKCGHQNHEICNTCENMALLVLLPEKKRVDILYTGGTFDLFHAGHVNFLRECKKIALKVIVSLNSDEFVLRYKGKYPVIPFEQRKEVLLSCRYVDDVILNTGDEDSKPAILSVNPDIIAVGDDWENRDYCSQMQFTHEWLKERNINLKYIPYTAGVSSSEIKNRI